jgi:hypothetical protein
MGASIEVFKELSLGPPRPEITRPGFEGTGLLLLSPAPAMFYNDDLLFSERVLCS